jgi:hypothetical protein
MGATAEPDDVAKPAWLFVWKGHGILFVTFNLSTAENGAFQPLAEDRQRIKVLSVCLPALFILSLYGFLLLLLFFLVPPFSNNFVFVTFSFIWSLVQITIVG